MFRGREERKVSEAGFDPARLPPGQHMTEKWPVLHAGGVPSADLATWTFRVFGEVEQEVSLTWEQFNALPRSENVQDIHCVTRWSRFDTEFEGVHWRELAALARPLPTARFAVAWAEHDFTSNFPLELARGRPRPARHARRRRAAHPRSRLSAPPRDPAQVLLEERQVAPRHRAAPGRPARILGALRLQQQRRPWQEERYCF